MSFDYVAGRAVMSNVPRLVLRYINVHSMYATIQHYILYNVLLQCALETGSAGITDG